MTEDAAVDAQDSTRDERSSPATRSSENALAEYRRRKLELAQLIQALMSITAERHDEEKQSAGRGLLARLAEDAFQLAVVGQFSRGKSTLMNAILGNAYLPTGALPMTSVVTTVKYGSRPRVLIQRAENAFPIETTLDKLVQFVAEASAERTELRVLSAQVEVPAEILRLGFSFVDTPGIGSAIAANTAATESFLPEADAVIFVTSFDAPLSEVELGFLTKVREQVGKLFVVVNKLDLVPEREVEKILDYVRDQVASGDGGGEVRVFATSARRALEARMEGDPRSLAESGVLAFEQPLASFLAGEKSRVFLQQVAARTERLLRRHRLDLELARVAQSDDVERKTRDERFERSMVELVEQVHDARRALRERIEIEIPPALVEQSQAWPRELGLLLRPELEHRWQESEEQAARDRFETARQNLLDAAEKIAETWFRQRVLDAQSLLVRRATAEIARLRTLQESVDRVAAEALGLAVSRDAARVATRSPADLPLLAVRVPEINVSLDLPQWRKLASRARGDDVDRLLHALGRGIEAYCAATRDELEDATNAWAETFGGGIDAETRRAVDHLRERLQLPGSEGHLRVLDELEQRLDAFRAALLEWRPQSDVPAVPTHAASRTTQARVATQCVICERIGRIPFDYLADVQYELERRESSRAAHAANGGFCALHTWQYSQTASFVGIALTYADLAASATEALRAATREASNGDTLRQAVARFILDSDRCPVCRATAEAQAAAIAELIDGLAETIAAGCVPALCIPHVAAVLDAGPGVDQATVLVESIADVLGRAAEDLRTYVLKRESLRRQLLNDEERHAYHQTIARVAGHRELARPWRIDDRL